ncbi:MAG: hypothetical protein IPP51_16710 [Bacteroidetes bacterium]|nr:hypothetical protein [Bacteroidota bacterium]
MRFILFIALFACVIGRAQAQQLDSTEIKLQQLKTGVIFMRENLDKSHRQFRTGTTLFLAGAGVAVISAFVPPEELVRTGGTKAKTYDFRTGVAIVGAVVNLVGAIFMVDSHKYIGRAGRWKFNGSGIAMEF